MSPLADGNVERFEEMLEAGSCVGAKILIEIFHAPSLPLPGAWYEAPFRGNGAFTTAEKNVAKPGRIVNAKLQVASSQDQPAKNFFDYPARAPYTRNRFFQQSARCVS